MDKGLQQGRLARGVAALMMIFSLAGSAAWAGEDASPSAASSASGANMAPVMPDMVSSSTLTSASAAAVGADYRIGADDQIEVNVFQIKDLSQSVQVDASGKIL